MRNERKPRRAPHLGQLLQMTGVPLEFLEVDEIAVREERRRPLDADIPDALQAVVQLPRLRVGKHVKGILTRRALNLRGDEEDRTGEHESGRGDEEGVRVALIPSVRGSLLQGAAQRQYPPYDKESGQKDRRAFRNVCGASGVAPPLPAVDIERGDERGLPGIRVGDGNPRRDEASPNIHKGTGDNALPLVEGLQQYGIRRNIPLSGGRLVRRAFGLGIEVNEDRPVGTAAKERDETAVGKGGEERNALFFEAAVVRRNAVRFGT